MRKAKYDLDEAPVKPYFELNNVLAERRLLRRHAALRHHLQGAQGHSGLPARRARVRSVRRRRQAAGALLLRLFQARQQATAARGWTALSGQSKLLGTLPVVYNVANFTKPAPGEPALISFDDVTTMFHEFGHALHGMFANQRSIRRCSRHRRPARLRRVSLAVQRALGASIRRSSSTMRQHYKTGAPMPAELVAKIKKAATFNQGYALTELLAAAELDMQWHTAARRTRRCRTPDTFETGGARENATVDSAAVPPRYRSSYFLHIWANGYAAGYYAYLWTEMLDDDAFAWFAHHGGLTRANGDRFRQMVLSRGNTEDLESLYEAWRGGPPSIEGLLRQRGLMPEGATK